MKIIEKNLDGEDLLRIRDALIVYKENNLTEKQWETTQNIISRIEDVLINAYNYLKKKGEENEQEY